MQANLPKWDHTIDIKGILYRDPANTSKEYAATTSHEIGALLRARLPKALLTLPGDCADLEIIEIVEHFEALPVEADSLANFNDNLACLYDWADHNRVSLGLAKSL